MRYKSLSDICVANISFQSVVCLFYCSETSCHAPMSVDIFLPLSNISCSHETGLLLSFQKCHTHSQLYGFTSALPPVWTLAAIPSTPGFSLPGVAVAFVVYSTHLSIPSDSLFMLVLYISMFCLSPWMLAPS